MDEIAKEAGYSKATLYVYFKNKEEIVGALVLESMRLLHARIQTAILGRAGIKNQYMGICRELAAYQEQFPFYFEIALGEINVDFDKPDALAVDKETFDIGEAINRELAQFVVRGIQENVFRPNIPVPQTVFLLWASLSGTILMSVKKRQYIEKSMGLTKQEFLEYGFETLFRSIQAEPATTQNEIGRIFNAREE